MYSNCWLVDTGKSNRKTEDFGVPWGTPYESTSLSIHRSKDWKNEKGPWAVPSEGPQQLTLSIRGGEPVDTSVQIDDDDDDDDDDDYGFLVLLIVSH